MALRRILSLTATPTSADNKQEAAMDWQLPATCCRKLACHGKKYNLLRRIAFSFFTHFVFLDDGSTPNDISQAVSPAFTAAFLWGHAHIFAVVPMLG
jgi:hypothetical protein